MAKKICIQVGHQNYQHHAISGLKRNAGAPGELEGNIRIVNRLSAVLREKGFDVFQTDAVAYVDKRVTETDWDLFLSCHMDADVYGEGGGFTAVPAPHTDFAAKESERIREDLAYEYFKHSNISPHPERRNKNTEYYYMWKYLSAKTPCVLIECGVVQDAHDSVLLADTDRIANAIGRGICRAFSVSFENAEETPDYSDQNKIMALESKVSNLSVLLANQKQDCQNKLKKLKNGLNKIKSLAIELEINFET